MLELIDAQPAEIGTELYDSLSRCCCRVPEIEQLRQLDPLGPEYRQIAMAIYERFSQRNSYNPNLDEKSGIGESRNVWRETSPFSFGTTKFVSEFLVSWGAIFSALDASAGMSVLEYGSGSGQALCMLARTGLDCSAVDIDAASLNQIRLQSEAMDVPIHLEQNVFGAGFDDKTFDRVLFFEAFHHSIDFPELLLKLHHRLNPGGFLVFCGEPIVDSFAPSVPYPWGPRLDGLSVLCIRRYGWMELGFEAGFFRDLLMAHGWLVELRPSPVYRATVYKALPTPAAINPGDSIWMDSTWSAPEGTHRWTTSRESFFTLPWAKTPKSRIRVVISNYLPEVKQMIVATKTREVSMTLGGGESGSLEIETEPTDRQLFFRTNVTPMAGESRLLGMAVNRIEFLS